METSTTKPATRKAAPPFTIQVETITPEIAVALLEHNTDNPRKLEQSWVDFLCGVLRRGEWRLNADPIRICVDGTLMDGQHRLWAVVETGISIETVVARNIPKEVGATIDTDRLVRSIRHVLKKRGEVDVNALSSAVRHQYIHDTAGLEGFSQRQQRISVREYEAVLKKHPGLRDAALVARAVHKIVGPGTYAYCYYQMAQVDQAKAEEFTEMLATGLGFTGERDPVYRLWLRLNEARRKQGTKLTQLMTLRIVNKAWIYFLLDHKVANLRIQPGEQLESWDPNARPKKPSMQRAGRRTAILTNQEVGRVLAIKGAAVDIGYSPSTKKVVRFSAKGWRVLPPGGAARSIYSLRTPANTPLTVNVKDVESLTNGTVLYDPEEEADGQS